MFLHNSKPPPSYIFGLKNGCVVYLWGTGLIHAHFVPIRELLIKFFQSSGAPRHEFHVSEVHFTVLDFQTPASLSSNRGSFGC